VANETNTFVGSDGSGAGAREVPGVGRLTVADDHQELLALAYSAMRDASVAGILADWLRDRDDARADLIADLAAPGVIPDRVPVANEEVPLVAGRDWCAVRRANGVFARAYPGSPLERVIEFHPDAYKSGHYRKGGSRLKRAPVRYAYRIVPEEQNPESVRSALHRGRTWLVLATFGTFPHELAKWRQLFFAKGMKEAVDAVGQLCFRGRGDWLVRLKASNPERFRAIMRHEDARRVLRLPQFAALRRKCGRLVTPPTPRR
jgi:hypothetical protein